MRATRLEYVCAGLTIPLTFFHERFIAQRGLVQHIVRSAEGSLALQFLFRDPVPLLPVLVDDMRKVMPWGNRDDRHSALPHTGWCRVESLSRGTWDWLHPREVQIPAERGLEKGVWFRVPGSAIRGVLVKDATGGDHVYMLTQPATQTYRQLTGHEREPVFIGGVI